MGGGAISRFSMYYLWINIVVGDRVNSCGIQDIDCQVDYGNNYEGNVSQTIGGYKCEFWHKQTKNPNQQNLAKAGKKKLGPHNYCRNPVDNKLLKAEGKKVKGVWCYSTEPGKRWALCDVRKCGPCDKGKGL